jgi:hypothetical protein
VFSPSFSLLSLLSFSRHVYSSACVLLQDKKVGVKVRKKAAEDVERSISVGRAAAKRPG